jgi:hypothetical protein
MESKLENQKNSITRFYNQIDFSLFKSFNSQISIDDLIKKCYHNNYSMLLTRTGYSLFSKYCLETKYTSNKLFAAKHLLALSRHIKEPYYMIDGVKKIFIVFAMDGETSFELLLVDGNLEIYAKIKS